MKRINQLLFYNNFFTHDVFLVVEQKRRMSQIEMTKMALKKVESDSEEEKVITRGCDRVRFSL